MPHPRTLARLKRALQTRGILQKAVAEEAGVSKFQVSHVLAGRAKSQNVVDTVKRMLAAAPVRDRNAIILIAALLFACR